MKPPLLFALVVCAAGCVSHSPAQSELSLEQMWLNKGGDSRSRGDIDDFELPYQRMCAVLTELPPERFDREYEHLVQSPDTECSYLYLESMIDVLEERFDEGRLIRLLASHCPSSVFDPIEWRLARTFEHPVTILEKSYRSSKNPETRKNLVIVFRRAFPDISRRVNDNSVVDACVNWYSPLQNTLVPNLNFPSQYGLQATSNRQSQTDLPDENALPLFILRSKESPENKFAREGAAKYKAGETPASRHE